MRTIVSGQHAANDDEFAELALGIDSELFTGPTDRESAPERAARLAAAHDILQDLRREDPELANYAGKLLATASTEPFADASFLHLSVLISGIPPTGKAGYLAMFGQVAA
jgi:hypothetical protein